MTEDESGIRSRMEDVLNSILCPISGCWSLHGCKWEYFHDTGEDVHVMQVWPVGIMEENGSPEGNGHELSDQGLLYELAEFDFSELATTIPIEHFHFSQRRGVFEIGWKESEKDFELRVYIAPQEVSDV